MDKELRKFGRSELIEIIYELQKQDEQHTAQIKALEDELNRKEIKIAESGSIAEAALRLNEVFEAAQTAAEQYLQAVHRAEEEEQKRLLNEAEAKAAEIIAAAEAKAAEILNKTLEV